MMFIMYDFPVPAEPGMKKYEYLLFETGPRHWIMVLMVLYCSVGRSSMAVVGSIGGNSFIALSCICRISAIFGVIGVAS